MSDSRRRFLTFATGAIAGIGVAAASIPFIRSLSRPKYRSTYYIDIEFPKLKGGQLTQGVLFGQPIFVVRRTSEQIAMLESENSKLKDPSSLESKQPESSKNPYRSQKAEIFVGVGLCTHLGCSPGHISKEQSDERFPEGGYFCPCHGAVYDAAGRVYSNGPAPYNMEVPRHKFIEESVVRVWHK